jgi:flavorubredoxin
MGTIDNQSGLRVDEIADAIYRISTPVPQNLIPGGFTFNVFLLKAEEPLLFHTAPRRMLPQVRAGIASLMPPERLRYISFSHFESDECGSLNELLEMAPNAIPVCGRIGGMTSIADFSSRAPRVMADGERISLGDREVQWIDMPHVPHGWDCGVMFETRSRTLFCSDLFTQPGEHPAPLTEDDILGPSEALRSHLEYFAHAPNTTELLEKAARLEPATLACMHGSSWRGDGAAMIRRLAQALSKQD